MRIDSRRTPRPGAVALLAAIGLLFASEARSEPAPEPEPESRSAPETSPRRSEGAVLDACADPAGGGAILFVRFPDPREVDLALEIRGPDGRPVARLAGRTEAGSALFVWDGTGEAGDAAGAGPYVARIEGGPEELIARFEIP